MPDDDDDGVCQQNVFGDILTTDSLYIFYLMLYD